VTWNNAINETEESLWTADTSFTEDLSFLGSDAVSIGKQLMSWIWVVIQDREDGGSKRLRIQIDMPHIPENLNIQHHCKNPILHYHRYFTSFQVFPCSFSVTS
jgi:hypothetical protein